MAKLGPISQPTNLKSTFTVLIQLGHKVRREAAAATRSEHEHETWKLRLIWLYGQVRENELKICMSCLHAILCSLSFTVFLELYYRDIKDNLKRIFLIFSVGVCLKIVLKD